MPRTLPLLALVCAIGLLLAACATPTARGPITIEREHAERFAGALNDYRRSKGLSPVRVDSRLMAAAEEQARAVAAIDRLDHNASGRFPSRLHRNGVDARAAFENLAAGDREPIAALASWRASPAHHENLLRPEATRIGFVRARAPQTRFRTFDVLVLASD